MNRDLVRGAVLPPVLNGPRPSPRLAIVARNDGRLAGTSFGPLMASAPHLVIKRGHHGRYRFTMLTDNGRVSGEVKVDNTGISRAEQDASARAEVMQLAATLVASTGAQGE